MAGLAHVLLALAWTAVTGRVTLANIGVGFVIALAVLMVASPDGAYVRRVGRVVALAGFFATEVAHASVRIARDVLSPRHAMRMRPGIIAVPLDARTDLEIFLLANLLTLTPGSLSLDVSDDRRTLYVHVMYVSDVDSAIREIKDGYERRLLEVLR